jgi:hypothetical protein
MPFAPKNKAARKHRENLSRPMAFAPTKCERRLIPEAARLQEMTVSEWIRNAIDQALEDQGFELTDL